MCGFSCRRLRVAGLALFLSGCSLPAATPMRGAVTGGAEYPVVTVDRALAQRLSQDAPERFGADFTRAAVLETDRIRPGDLLNVQIFENVDNGLLGATSRTPTLLGPLEVGGDGTISLPYAGQLKVSGRRVEDLRADLVERLAQQTPDPQVIVMRQPGAGFSVTISGNASGGGVVPLNYGQRTLRAAMAAMVAVGGVAGDPALVHVEVMRGGKRARLDQIETVPGQDIALRPGDAITLRTEKPRIAVLGAAAAQGAVALDRAGETLVAALARAGGLNASASDAKGLFVMRGTGAGGAAGPTIYAFDMTRPEGIFAAEAFALDDGDVVYVSEVAISRAGRALRTLLGFVQPVDQVTTSLGG